MRSGQRFRAMPQTACATTATATTFSPCSQGASATASVVTPYAKSTSTMADGSVNPTHAATPPRSPARLRDREETGRARRGPHTSPHQSTGDGERTRHGNSPGARLARQTMSAQAVSLRSALRPQPHCRPPGSAVIDDRTDMVTSVSSYAVSAVHPLRVGAWVWLAVPQGARPPIRRFWTAQRRGQ